ncbi:hypothetical protein TrRE_jg3409, partial [Triparma retinervis]
GVSRRSIKASDEEEEGNGMKAADEEILRLKFLLDSNEKEMEESRAKFIAKDKEVKERDEKIARLEERIARLEERG